MKSPLFDEVERIMIINHYNNKIIHPKTFLIERYELAKSISNFKKAIKHSRAGKTTFKILIRLLKKIRPFT